MPVVLPSAEAVIELTGTSLPGVVVDSIIADALLIAENCIAPYSAERQTSIVKWLAAHLVASTDAGGAAVTSKKLGDASENYGRAQVGESLSGTMYGQQALALDTNGCLRRLGKGRASVERI